jgi:hypothetical protein
MSSSFNWKGPWSTLILSAALLLTCAAYGASNELVAGFEAANRLYESGRYPEAVAAYRNLLSSNRVSSALLFNLGNAEFKAGHIGRAIHAYKAAENLAPRDPDLQANLQFARNRVQGPRATASPAEHWFSRLTLNEWTWLGSTSLWLFFLLLVLRQWRPAWVSRTLLLTWGILTLLSCVSVGAAFAVARGSLVAVVVNPETTIHHGPLEESPAAFIAKDGAELLILDQKDEWFRVSDGKKRFGWVERENIALSGP